MLLAVKEAGTFKVTLLPHHTSTKHVVIFAARGCACRKAAILHALTKAFTQKVLDLVDLQVVLLMRQCIPYTWFNYAAAAPPDIQFQWYFIASVIGQVPHNAVDVYLGGNVAGLGDLLK